MKVRGDYYSQYMENHTICLGRNIHFAPSSNHFDKDWLVILVVYLPPEKYEFVRLIIIPTIGENKVHVPNHQAVKLWLCWLPSGKRLHNELENHHAINGKNHYFYGHFPVRKLLIYQAGYIPIAGLLDFWWLTAWTLRHGSSSFFTLQLWKGRSAPWRRVNPRLELPSLVPYRVNVYKKTFTGKIRTHFIAG